MVNICVSGAMQADVLEDTPGISNSCNSIIQFLNSCNTGNSYSSSWCCVHRMIVCIDDGSDKKGCIIQKVPVRD